MVMTLLLAGCNIDRNSMNDGAKNIEPTRFSEKMSNKGPVDRGITTKDNNTRRNNNTTNINNRHTNNKTTQNRYDVSKEAADKITKEVSEIHHAYVLTTDNNAYVAAVLDNDERHQNRMNHDPRTGDTNINKDNNLRTRDVSDRRMNDVTDNGAELTDGVKNKIADIVQSIDNNIDNVYVTTNPDFADLTNDFMNDVDNGKPVRGFFDQIGNMIERVFPQNKR